MVGTFCAIGFSDFWKQVFFLLAPAVLPCLTNLGGIERAVFRYSDMSFMSRYSPTTPSVPADLALDPAHLDVALQLASLVHPLGMRG